MKRILLFLSLLPALLAAQPRNDWAQFSRYAKANAELETPPAVVFMGNSITDYWYGMHPAFFTENNYVCRGISGQVTAQMLHRFRADVIELHPQAVVILAGTNDIARSNGSLVPEHLVENIVSMAEQAHAAGIRPILCSVLPVSYHRRSEPGNVSQQIRDLNARLKHDAAERGFTWVDYHSAMTGKDGGLNAEYTSDGVHPNAAGYAVMERIVAPALTMYN